MTRKQTPIQVDDTAMSPDEMAYRSQLKAEYSKLSTSPKRMREIAEELRQLKAGRWQGGAQ